MESELCTALLVNANYAMICMHYFMRRAIGNATRDFVVPRDAVREDITRSVSFGPAAFNLAYVAGALTIIEQYPNVFANTAYLGTSTGSIVACLACVGMSTRTMVDLLDRFSQDVSSTAGGTLIEMLDELLERELPSNAHELCNGKLVVGITQMIPGCVNYHPTFISSFERRRDLIHAILCSCSIPHVQDGHVRRGPRNTFFIDGAFSMNHAVLETLPTEHKTITVGWDARNASRSDVLPSVQVPLRIVTPPSACDMYELISRGASDFETYIAERTTWLQ
jgi:hypothetical protein